MRTSLAEICGDPVLLTITLNVFPWHILNLAVDSSLHMKDIYDMDLLQLGKTLLIRYLVFTGGYAIITHIVYLIRYKKARHSLRMYYNNLRRLNAMYKKE